jgi:hypothetical protein
MKNRRKIIEWTKMPYSKPKPHRSRETNIDFDKALKHLNRCKYVYKDMGYYGYPILTLLIYPFQERYNSGDRSPDLYDGIMMIDLPKGSKI